MKESNVQISGVSREVLRKTALAKMVSELTRDQVFDLIVGLDAEIGEWSFTERCAAHFDGLRKVRMIEESLDVANSEKPNVGTNKIRWS